MYCNVTCCPGRPVKKNTNPHKKSYKIPVIINLESFSSYHQRFKIAA
jgi:hypothetical protein